MDEEIVVAGSSWLGVASSLGMWTLTAAVAWISGLLDHALLILAVSAPLVVTIAAWALLRQWVVCAGPDGVRIELRPGPLWAREIPRNELAVVSLEERVIPADLEELTCPEHVWDVVAVLRSGHTVRLASNLTSAGPARDIAARIRRATGC